jgi:hypothetical protein
MRLPSSFRWHTLLLSVFSVAVFLGTVVLSVRGWNTQADVTGSGTTVAASSATLIAQAGTDEVTLFLRPHCTESDQSKCASFTAINPTTLQSDPLAIGEVLHLDLVVQNPNHLSIKHVKTWLQFEPATLEGLSVLPSEKFPTMAPQSLSFDTEKGVAMLDVETAGLNGSTDAVQPAAEIQFIIKDLPVGGKTAIAFYGTNGADPQTAVYTSDTPPRNVLSGNLGILSVVTQEGTPEDIPPAAGQLGGSGSSVSSVSSAQTVADTSSSTGVLNPPVNPLFDIPPFGETSSAASVPASASSAASSETAMSSAASLPEPVSSASSVSSALPPPPASSSAPAVVSSSSQASVSSSSSALHAAAGTGTTQNGRSTFVLLQVQNVRVTTEGSTLYIAWDALPSTGLLGYNIYYGTETGRYIQRRTVRSTETALAVHSLPEGSTYYTAIRGFNDRGEETAFSQEAAVTIGDPATSTAPLSASRIPTGPQGKNPLTAAATKGGEVPASGLPSDMVLLLVASAVIGMFFAFRRQFVAHASHP